MSRRYTHNYLRRFRKQSGLTQAEVAFLLGCHCGAKVSRYENLTREPSLATAFACQAVYRVPVHELFPGMYTVVESQVKRRALVLDARLQDQERICVSTNQGSKNKRIFVSDLEAGIESQTRSDLWENSNQLRLF